jgi:hypothetical protein
MIASGSQLIVERVHKLSSRPWLLVTGRLEGDPLHIGDTIIVNATGQRSVPATVRSIEMHSAPGTTTIAVDAELEAVITAGTTIVRS